MSYESGLGLRPCWGCGARPAPGKVFQACAACQKFNLVAVSFCSPECQLKHWPRHEKWHRKQQKLAKRLHAVTPKVEVEPDDPRWSAKEKEYQGLLRQAIEFREAANYHKAAKTLRQALRLWPEQPCAYQNMGNVLLLSGDPEGACRNFLLAESRWPKHDADWASSISSAFNTLRLCPAYPRPSWWNDAELLRLSEEAAAVCRKDEPEPLSWAMRANVLLGKYDGDANPRTIAQLREGGRCFARAAELSEAQGDTTWAEMQRRNEAHALRMVEEKAEELRASIAARRRG